MYGLGLEVFRKEAASALVKNLIGVGGIKLYSALCGKSRFEFAMAV